jgi:hypothetical protein
MKKPSNEKPIMKKPIKDEYPDYTERLEDCLDKNGIELHYLKNVIANQTAALAKLNAELANQTAALTERDAELAKQNAKLAERDAELANQTAALTEQLMELAELRKTNYKQTNQINKMGWQINNLAGQLHYQQPQFVKANLPRF